MPAELTIVIPARNESQSLPKLLTSLNQQDYLHLPDTRVFVADANSTDGTAEMARSFAAKFPIEVLPGGLPSVGRNAGARRATTPYVLFLDADVELRDPTLLRRAVRAMQRHELHCLTTNIRCIDGNAADRLLFGGSNVVQKLLPLGPAVCNRHVHDVRPRRNFRGSAASMSTLSTPKTTC